MSDTKLNDEPDTYPDTYLDWISSLKSKEIIRSMWTRMSLEERKEFWDEDDKNKEEEEQDEEEQDEEEYEDGHPNERLCCICHTWLPSEKVTKLYIRNDKEGEWYCYNCPLSSW